MELKPEEVVTITPYSKKRELLYTVFSLQTLTLNQEYAIKHFQINHPTQSMNNVFKIFLLIIKKCFVYVYSCLHSICQFLSIPYKGVFTLTALFYIYKKTPPDQRYFLPTKIFTRGFVYLH